MYIGPCKEGVDYLGVKLFERVYYLGVHFLWPNFATKVNKKHNEFTISSNNRTSSLKKMGAKTGTPGGHTATAPRKEHCRC